MSRAVVIGAGSCIVEAVINCFRTAPWFNDVADIHLFQLTASGRPPVDTDLLARCDILIEEAAPWKRAGTLSEAERAALRGDCSTVSIPTLHFNMLWPLMVKDSRNVPEPDAPYGRIPFGMGDRLALKLFRSVPNPAERWARYAETDLTELVDLDRFMELEASGFFAREQGCDVRVAAFVMTEFRNKRLFYTHAHPTGELLLFVLAQVFAIPALRELLPVSYDQCLDFARSWADGSGAFVGEDAPIHPGVARHFGLRWWAEDLQYRWLGRHHTFRQWVEFLLTYDPHKEAAPDSQAAETTIPALPEPPPATDVPAEPGVTEALPPRPAERVASPTQLPIGPYLAAEAASREPADWELVRRAEEITRAAPIACEGPGIVFAPLARMFTDLGSRHYAVPPIWQACLRDALVVGHEGVVIVNGQVVGDTLRNALPTRQGSLILAADAREIRFRLAPRAIARRVAAPLFLGFANVWDDAPHWLVTALPRLIAFQALRAREPALRLIVPQTEPGSLQAETLALLGITGALIERIGPQEVLAPDRLYTFGALDLWSVSPLAREAAETIVRRAGLTHRAVPGRRLFILPPPGHARPVNLSELLGMARRHGIQAVDQPVGMDLLRMVATSEACIHIGSGPPLVQFCPPGASALQLCNPGTLDPLAWSLASISGISFGALVGMPLDANAPDSPQAPFHIDVVPFGRMLDRMTSGATARATPETVA